MKRIGLFGGSFDPVHNGHLEVARTVYRELQLDELWFVPAIQNPLKQRQLTDIADRVNMIRMMIEPYRHFKISLIEKKNTIPSYTINTMRLIKKLYPNDHFYWIIGSDNLGQLQYWKDIDELRQLVEFVCVARDQTTSDEVIMINKDPHPGNSTDVRNGDFTHVPSKIRTYIMNNGLYCETIAASTVSEERFHHVRSVASLAYQIAIGNNYDPEKAYIAGMYHDCAKDMDKDLLETYMDICYPEHKDLNRHIWHQYVGEAYLKRYFRMTDKEILNAVKHHCLGDSKNTLSKIIYCADKLDPTRGYDSTALIEECIRNINRGYDLVYAQQQDYLRKEGVL